MWEQLRVEACLSSLTFAVIGIRVYFASGYGNPGKGDANFNNLIISLLTSFFFFLWKNNNKNSRRLILGTYVCTLLCSVPNGWREFLLLCQCYLELSLASRNLLTCFAQHIRVSASSSSVDFAFKHTYGNPHTHIHIHTDTEKSNTRVLCCIDQRETRGVYP